MSSTITTTRTNLTTINGELAVPITAMPASWQRIQQGKWMTEPGVYTAWHRFFWPKINRARCSF
jgi:hypothetical protein